MLAKWNPFNGMSRRRASPAPMAGELLREVDGLLRAPLFNDVALPASWWSAPALVPPADVVELDDALVVTMDLPGYDPKTLKVTLEGELLTVQAARTLDAPASGRGWLRAERAGGSFSRTFALTKPVNAEACEARLEHGVLTVTMPLRAEARPRSVEVKVTS